MNFVNSKITIRIKIIPVNHNIKNNNNNNNKVTRQNTEQCILPQNKPRDRDETQHLGTGTWMALVMIYLYNL